MHESSPLTWNAVLVRVSARSKLEALNTLSSGECFENSAESRILTVSPTIEPESSCIKGAIHVNDKAVAEGAFGLTAQAGDNSGMRPGETDLMMRQGRTA